MTDTSFQISDSTYRKMRDLGWCSPCKKGVCDLTPLGTEKLMEQVNKMIAKEDAPVRSEWLAPN